MLPFGYNLPARFSCGRSRRASFRIRAGQAPTDVPKGEVVVLSGRSGAVYYLAPVQGDPTLGVKELRRAIAAASLQESLGDAAKSGLNQLSDVAVDEVISE